MAKWVSHSIVADRLLERMPHLCPFEFHIGNIAPDCNLPTVDIFTFEPPRQVTHWMSEDYKQLSDAERFLDEYVKPKKSLSQEEESFLLGYYTHLITDDEYRNFTHNPQRLAKMWYRIKTREGLRERAIGMLGGWDEVKLLFSGTERLKDIYSIESKYLHEHTDGGYLKYIYPNKAFPVYEFQDYIDYLPHGAIPVKIMMLAYLPFEIESEFPYVVITEEEYNGFLESAAEKAAEGIERYYKSIENG